MRFGEVNADAYDQRIHIAMKVILKFAAAAMCLVVAAFCTFGFLATFEPGLRGVMFFRIAYGSVGLGCIGIIVALTASAFHHGK